MKFAKLKDFLKRSKFKKQEIARLKLKFLFINKLNFHFTSLSLSSKKKANVRLLYLKNLKTLFEKISKSKFSKTKIVRRCILTNRSRGSLQNFGVSRSLLRELLQFGIVPGYKKAVW